jgi:hypothetical protein
MMTADPWLSPYEYSGEKHFIKNFVSICQEQSAACKKQLQFAVPYFQPLTRGCLFLYKMPKKQRAASRCDRDGFMRYWDMTKPTSGRRKDRVTEWAIGQPLSFPPKAVIREPSKPDSQQSKRGNKKRAAKP